VGRYCRDCCRALVTGRDALSEPGCRCALGCWGPESWPCALVVPACASFQPAEEQPGSLRFWGLQPGHGLEPESRRKRRTHAEGMQHLLTPTAARD